jgi:hypothetical protein
VEQAIAERGRRPLRDWVEAPGCGSAARPAWKMKQRSEDAAAYFDLLEGLAEGADLADFEWFRDQVNALFAQPSAQCRRTIAIDDHP